MTQIFEMRLYPSKLKFIALLFMCAVFFAFGFSRFQQGEKAGLYQMCFFGLMALIFIWALLPNALYLELNSDGFEYKTLGFSQSAKWVEIKDFGIVRSRYNDFVGWTWDIDFYNKNINWFSRLYKAKFGFHKKFQDNYNMPPQDLLKILQEMQSKYSLKK